MRIRLGVGLSLAASSAFLLSACTMAGTETPTSPADDPHAAEKSACQAVSDVESIISNATSSVTEGRMIEQERHGFQMVAARIYLRIEAPAGTELASALEGVRDELTVPDDAAANFLPDTDMESTEVRAARAAVRAACTALHPPEEWGIFGFVGG